MQLSALPEPVRGKKVICSGPYRFVRHPMYFGLLTWGLGKVFSSPELFVTALYLMLFGILFFKIRYEEGLLRTHYFEYQEYSAKTAGLIPFLI